MKKRIIAVLLIAVTLVALASCNEVREIEKFVDAFKEAGYYVDLSDKPRLEPVNAKDGFQFYVSNKFVYVYEFASEEDFQKGVEAEPVLASCPRNGNFVLFSSVPETVSIFKAVVLSEK